MEVSALGFGCVGLNIGFGPATERTEAVRLGDEASMPERQTCGEERVVHEILAIGWLERQRGVVGEVHDSVTSAERAAARRLITVPIGIPNVLAASP